MPPSPYEDYGRNDSAWLEIDWESHRRRIALDGAEVNYTDIGSGPAIVFVHGLGGRWQNWLENVPAMAEHHRVVALDLPGFGASPMPEWKIGIPAYGRMLTEFCDRLGLDTETAVVGNSMGGFIATESVISHPERFSRLVLVSAAGVTFARARSEPTRVIARLAKLSSPALAALGEDAITRPRLRRLAFAGVLHKPHLIGREMLWELAQGGLGPPGFSDALVALVGHDIRARLGEIELPTLVVWGFNDRVVPVRAALSYRNRIPNSRLEIFDRTGHVPMIERPRRFNAVLGEFLGDPDTR